MSKDESANPGCDTLPSVIVVDAVKTPADLPEHVQQIFCLLACGFAAASVARLCKVTRASMSQMIARWDPERRFALTAQERRRFLAQLWEARAGEALLHMTPDKFEDAGISDLARVAAIATTQAKALSGGREEPVSAEKLLAGLLAAASKGPAEPDLAE